MFTYGLQHLSRVIHVFHRTVTKNKDIVKIDDDTFPYERFQYLVH